MIELPEAMTLARQINETLSGKRIEQVVANASPHKFAWYSGDPAGYPNKLTGKTIQKANAFGNHVEIESGDMTMVISTPIKYHRAGEKVPPKHQLYLAFDDHSAISCTVQMWGAMMCFSRESTCGLPDYEIARKKPSPLTDDFDREYFNSLLDEETPKLSTKAFLATEQRIPGLGNGVLQDILWTAHLHPKRKMGDLSGLEMTDMFMAVKQVLVAMTEQGGRDTERDLFGYPGGYHPILSKNSIDSPCPACGSPICKEPYLGGAIYYCPTCQNLP